MVGEAGSDTVERWQSCWPTQAGGGGSSLLPQSAGLRPRPGRACQEKELAGWLASCAPRSCCHVREEWDGGGSRAAAKRHMLILFQIQSLVLGSGKGNPAEQQHPPPPHLLPVPMRAFARHFSKEGRPPHVPPWCETQHSHANASGNPGTSSCSSHGLPWGVRVSAVTRPDVPVPSLACSAVLKDCLFGGNMVFPSSCQLCGNIAFVA